jgi:hypothetical protein
MLLVERGLLPVIACLVGERARREAGTEAGIEVEVEVMGMGILLRALLAFVSISDRNIGVTMLRIFIDSPVSYLVVLCVRSGW